MKKLLTALGLSAIIAASIAIGAYAATDIKLWINGKVIETDIQIVNGSSYVPLRVVSESLGAEVKWDGNKRTISITSQAAPASILVTPAPTSAAVAPTPIPSPIPTVTPSPAKVSNTSDYTLEFPVDRYPRTAQHIRLAIAKGESSTCTIDREGADNNRYESLRGIPTKEGYDRDEWPMAMCAEGGTGADVDYVLSNDNRGSGSWVGNQLEKYPNGTRVLFTLKVSTAAVSTPIPTSAPSNVIDFVKYKSCAEVKAAGKAPIRTGDPGYSTSLDRDGDGIACEA